MPSWRSSAAYRIALVNFIAFALGLAVLGIVVFKAMHISFTRQLDSMLTEEAEDLRAEFQSGGNRDLLEAIAEREGGASPSRMLYAVFTPDGRRILGGLQARRPQLGVHSIMFLDPREGPDSGRGAGIDLSSSERLLVAADADWIERIDRTVITVFGIAFAAACALGLTGALFLARYLRRRLQAISRTAEAIIGGNVRMRMPIGARRDEFDNLALTLNRMLDRIEGLLENLRQVSSDVAHDLRTPLARLRTRLEEGALKSAKNECTAAVIEDSINQVDEVLSLFAAILRIAEVEAGETRRYFKSVDLSGLLTELAESYAPAIEDGGRTLLSSIASGVAVEGDRELLAQAIINLVENAQRHTPPGSSVRLSLTSSATTVFVQVTDDGPGVPAAELASITKRFSRVEASRSTAGYGLGLNLVRAIAKLHDGRLVLKNVHPGLSAIIELPAGERSASLAGSEQYA